MGKMKEIRERDFWYGTPYPGSREESKLEAAYKAWRAKTRLYPCVGCGKKNVSPDPRPVCPTCCQEMNDMCDRWAEQDRLAMEELGEE